MSGYPPRVLIGIAVAAVLAMVGAFDAYDSLAGFSLASPDSFKIGEQHRRLAGVTAALPPETVVGYISDQPFSTAAGQAAFFGVQYALAPRLLVEESDRRQQEWVVGSFLRKPDVAEIEKTHNLQLVREFGLGIYLFRRAR